MTKEVPTEDPKWLEHGEGYHRSEATEALEDFLLWAVGSHERSVSTGDLGRAGLWKYATGGLQGWSK